ncbi:unnamed protein product [Lactuca saligna]|uniref:Disease resistance protein winged helix domain-containing protein n=1 Tax=Lactuca saligna TaxID=75948 RepID=A0AA35Y2E1_LACSI|nr:unnamed protein product [Lactuca saligna]
MRQKNKEIEDVGNDIFQILVSNSLLQDVKRDEYGYIDSCSMHDLVHDLALSLSKHENLCRVTPKNNDIIRIPQIDDSIGELVHLQYLDFSKKMLGLLKHLSRRLCIFNLKEISNKEDALKKLSSSECPKIVLFDEYHPYPLISIRDTNM